MGRGGGGGMAYSQLDVAWTAIPCTSTALNEKGSSNRKIVSFSEILMCRPEMSSTHEK